MAARVEEVTAGVWNAVGFHLGNVIQVDTRDGAVRIDSTGGLANAAAARDAILERTDAPVRHLVYTHCHPDHCGGAQALVDDGTEHVVAHDLLPALWQRDMSCLWPWHRRVRSWQSAQPIEAGFPGYVGGDGGDGYLDPTLTFRDELDLEVGGVTLHLEHTEGETRDHLLVWIEELGVLCPGDLYYPAFPNLSSPAIGPRPIPGWVRSLDRMLELPAEHLVPSHGPAVSGRDAVREVLADYRDAIDHLLTEVERCLNDGIPVHVAADTVRLPDHLAAKPHLTERYGTVAWGVRAVYDLLTGWHAGDVADLDRHPADRLACELVAAAGADALAGRARDAVERGDPQLALELTTVVLDADPSHRAALEVRRDACWRLAAERPSMNEKGFYASGARIAEAALSRLDG